MASDYDRYQQMMDQLRQEQELKRTILENERLEREARQSRSSGERLARGLATGKGCAGVIVIFGGVVALSALGIMRLFF